MNTTGRSGAPLAAALLLLALLLDSGCSSPDRRAGAASPSYGPGRTAGPTLAERTRGMQRLPGFLTLYWDAHQARLYFEVPSPEKEILYYVSLPAGLGSNDVGLDRGQLGWSGQVEFRRVGPRIFLVAPNLKWRSSSEEPVERAAVADAFAESVLEGFDVVAEEGGRTLVDGTSFFLRDAHAIVRKLSDTGQGSFRLAAAKSTLLPDKLASFPSNTEVESLLTFESERPGSEVRSTASVPGSVSLRVRHSFVELPELSEHDYRPRRFDPSSGYFPFTWNDLGAPIDEPIARRVITRHHLTAERPIVYHVDAAAPEPVRTALLEGARFWREAFAAAGFPEGYRVELLPPDADPQDVRYNVIQWVPRSQRGWSYGMSIVDPRTGEILKGHVTLGALRVRQDILLFEGLTAPYADGADASDVVTGAALDRIRQLSAHEVGHTLGLAHNFTASLQNRASVMDYPAPRIRLDEHGEVDLSDAYAPGGGPWDVLAIRYGYTSFPPESEAGELEAILAEASTESVTYLSDRDARGAGRSHPKAHLWDTGSDPLASLETTYAVRARALARFSTDAVKPGRPFFDLERVLVPLYFHHRYQLEAAVRELGGVSYDYAIVGRDSSPAIETVSADRQRRAMALALDSLSPGFLALSPRLVELLPPPPPGHERDRETLRASGGFFQPLEAASAASDLTLGLLLEPARATRLADQSLRDATLPTLGELLEALTERVWSVTEEPGGFRAVRETVQAATLDHLFALAGNTDAPTRVRASAFERLRRLQKRLGDPERPGPHASLERERLRRFLEDPAAPAIERRGGVLPPGSPIGDPSRCCGQLVGVAEGP